MLLIAFLKLAMLMFSVCWVLKPWTICYKRFLSSFISSAFTLTSLRLFFAAAWSNFRSNVVFISERKTFYVIYSLFVFTRKYSFIMKTSSSDIRISALSKPCFSSSAEMSPFLFLSYFRKRSLKSTFSLRAFEESGLITSSMLKLKVLCSMNSEEIT